MNKIAEPTKKTSPKVAPPKTKMSKFAVTLERGVLTVEAETIGDAVEQAKKQWSEESK